MKSLDRYFSPDYFTARDRFRESAARAGARLEALPLKAKGPQGQDLTIDIAWFGSYSTDRVIVHSSGLHGVEGFAGSSIQLQLLNDFPSVPSNAAFIVVHILNPYGMAWLRRVNENNVDLNRNFRMDESYSGSPATYAKLDFFLNPRTPPASDLFFAKATYFVLRHGMSALKQSVVGGQYEFPKGLFFGGIQMEEGPRKYAAYLAEHLSSSQKAIVIDVHTGLGKFAHDSLLVESEDYADFRRIFGPRVTALQTDQSSAYRVEGGLQSMIFRVFSRTRPIFIGQEFGTYSGMKVVHALREENRWHQYGQGSLDHTTKRKLKEVFCPESESWRETVLNRGRELVEQALKEI
jgi:predicted deacylase